MFIPYLRQFCLFFLLSIAATLVHADVYKWVDEEGQTHYSQQAPVGQETELLKAPPPPASLPADAQSKIDQLINEQNEARYEQKRQAAEQQQTLKQQEQQETNCKRSQENLQKFLDNPGRRYKQADGTVTRLAEEERQKRIQEFKLDINEYCQ
ncbi:hypothetical protein A9Q79_09415 [Methylophaga sp. 42_25_T18]|nr:hypothetical protein A9Q79_09415 [Methylophaga sp. 42_25_T18]OUR87508.1 hypothetical protein A9Q92_04540 [Methylophaga sp. 42_8_T64]